VLFLCEDGLRNSTGRAVRNGDVKAELDAGLEIVHVPVRFKESITTTYKYPARRKSTCYDCLR
jgi:hypothetical protein